MGGARHLGGVAPSRPARTIRAKGRGGDRKKAAVGSPPSVAPAREGYGGTGRTRGVYTSLEMKGRHTVDLRFPVGESSRRESYTEEPGGSSSPIEATPRVEGAGEGF